tara:strand:+ start:8171 stop:9256 length:1086 start_codon:yes stop_codon:yes gene_type:complete
MKILYISPENTVNTLTMWKLAHEEKGNKCEFITLFKSRNNFDPGICLDLPLVTSKSWYMFWRHKYYQLFRGTLGDYKQKNGYPPIWKPNSRLEKYFFQFRDWLWNFYVEPAIKKNNLFDYDIYHFEWGLEFYRDCRFVNKLIDLDKAISCTYHGQDLRTRGALKPLNKASKLNITSELDLLNKHPNMKYMFLPYDTKQFSHDIKINDPIRICHAPTDRHYKGSETIIPICERLAKEKGVEFVLIEDKPFNEAQEIKKSCDILIDQVHNRGGWGYGMNSVEGLSMGLCCVTELLPEYVNFIPDHPFINADGKSLYVVLSELISNKDKIIEYKKKSFSWVDKFHNYTNTSNVLYSYYKDLGWL